MFLVNVVISIMQREKTMSGLSYKEVEERKKKGLVNGNYSVKTKSIKQIVFTNMFTLFNLINCVLAVLLLMVQSYKNMMFMGVVFWNLIIGIFQEVRSKRIIDKLSLLSDTGADVIRENNEENIKIEDIVMDDVMVLKNGKQICADAVVIEGKCEVNESLLTGESNPVYKQVGDELRSGSFLVSGAVKAKVIHVGQQNYVNEITGQAKYLKKPNSEMLKSIKMIIKFVTILLLPVSVLLFLNQMYLVDNKLMNAVVGTVAAIIGMIPSGLVLLTSMVLAVSVIKLAKKNTLVQELYCIESLARVDVLCLDKTGTITEGSMNVEDIVPVTDVTVGEIEKLLKVYTEVFEDKNPTSEAIEKYLSGTVCDINDKVLFSAGFSSEKKYSVVQFEKWGTLALGAYEFVVKNQDADVKNRVTEIGAKGLRVLVIAHSDKDAVNGNVPCDMKPLALVLVSDTIREEAYDTIEFFKSQGVDVKVISGDNPATVSYIAGKAGIENAGDYIDATELKSDEDINVASEKYKVFGRVTPAQKLKLIKALKSNGHTVAMTGDGVNDVMALKEADCSIAMQSGSEAARNVSQLVLMDSNFASMPYIVAEGRQTVNNIQRSASLYLNKTIYSTLLAILFIILPFSYPFQPVQLTLIGSLSIGVPSFILAMEINHNIIKGNFLKNILMNAVPGGLLVVTNILTFLAIGKIVGASSVQTATMCTYGLAIGSLINLFNVCRPLTKLRFALCAGSTIVFVLAVLGFRKFFGMHILDLKQWLFVAMLGTISYFLFVLYKKVVRVVLKS